MSDILLYNDTFISEQYTLVFDIFQILTWIPLYFIEIRFFVVYLLLWYHLIDPLIFEIHYINMGTNLPS